LHEEDFVQLGTALISVVVPVFNEELNIPIFYNELNTATEKSDFDIEIIFVNDGSRDSSWKAIQALKAKDARVKGFNLSKNSGSYAAIAAGFSKASGDAIMAISADLQDPPEIINLFFPKWKEGFDVVWGVRAGRKDPFFKALFAKVFYWVVRKMIFPDFPSDGMDIGLFSRRIIQEYLKIQDRNSIPFFTIYSLGFRQAQVPYLREKRRLGESGWPFWKRVTCAIDIFVGFSYVPIRIITAFGLLCAASGLTYAIVTFFRQLAFNSFTPGWSSIIILILFIGGIQMIFMGIIAEYLWRTNDRVKQRPIYCIMEEI